MNRVTLKTKGLTKDKNGNLGIWRTAKRKGRFFIRVGETADEAFSRTVKELLDEPIDALKQKSKSNRNDNIVSLIFDKISIVNEMLKESEIAYIKIAGVNYIYYLEINRDYEYKIINKRVNK